MILPYWLWAGELWLRLFACIIAPLVGTYLIAKEMQVRPDDNNNNDSNNNKDEETNNRKSAERRVAVAMVFGLASSTVLFTDTL